LRQIFSTMSKNNSGKSQSLKIPRTILLTGRFLQFISINLASKFASKIFITPIKHKIPKRELEMDQNSVQETVFIPKINKSIVVYHYGDSPRKVLLVHGWSGRGTQLVRFAEELLNRGFSTISFDAPAHGKSGSKTTLMPEFIASILELERLYGPFEYAIGHSLGGMSLLNSVKQGLKIKKLIIIGSGDIIQDIINAFVQQLQLKLEVADKMKALYEKNYGVKMEDYSAHLAAKSVSIPTLVIHDENDYEVPLFCGKNIYKHLPNGELFITTRLGHRKILGEKNVIQKTMDFIQN
jgi:pimeloyl-ACP methyl ester carboxylesterase